MTTINQRESVERETWIWLLTALGTLFLLGVGGILLGGAWLLLGGEGLVALLQGVLGISAQTPWYFSRAAGTVAYLLLSGSTVWGLLLSSKIIKEMVPGGLAMVMHNSLSWLAILFTAFHTLALLFDTYFSFTLTHLLVPFTGPYAPGWVGLGILALYLMVLITISFRFRRQLGQKRWRALHYLSFAVYLLATLHGFFAGSDSGNGGMQMLYAASGLLVFFLMNYRLLVGAGARRRRS